MVAGLIVVDTDFVFQLHTDGDAEPDSKDRSTVGIDDVPIFRTDEEKIEFESTLNVDLSCIDHMFKVSAMDVKVEKGRYVGPVTTESRLQSKGYD